MLPAIETPRANGDSPKSAPTNKDKREPSFFKFALFAKSIKGSTIFSTADLMLSILKNKSTVFVES